MSDEVLRLRGVEVRRDAAVLLRNVDWTAHENERWILIGPNGAGKTTLLQVAATSLFPARARSRCSASAWARSTSSTCGPGSG